MATRFRLDPLHPGLSRARSSRRGTSLRAAGYVSAVLAALVGGSGCDGDNGSGTGGSGGTASGSGGGATGGAGGAGGSQPSGGTGGTASSTAPCPAGSLLTAADTDAGFAEYGSVFSSTPYVYDQAGTHNPKALVIEVQSGGQPVAGCEVGWETAPGHGWVFPSGPTTAADGRIRAFWTAGAEASQVAVARIAVEGGADQTVAFTGQATPSPRTRTDSVHILYDVPNGYTELKVRVTPVTGPPTTYYSTANWPGAYGGIQFGDGGAQGWTMVLFSVWDVNDTSKAEILDAGACNETVGFGGEGTGTSCRLRLPPSTYGPIVGLPDDYRLQPGDTYETHLLITYPAACSTCSDYTFTFTDVTRGFGPISLGTQRYKEHAVPWYGLGFIEDWWDQVGDHCLNAGTRTAYFHDIQARTAGGWQAITSASFNAVYRPDNHEICANYFFGVETGRFLMSSGGSDLVSRPIIEGDPDFGAAPTASL